MTAKSFAVLIVGYQRVEAVRTILEQCLLSEVDNVLISIDYPRNTSKGALANNSSLRNLVLEFEGKFGRLHARFLDTNVGCSANVLSACDWAFGYYDAVAILEDDCQPSIGFFDYCQDSNEFLKKNEDVLLACGTQFVPKSLTNSNPYLSKYALTWGWFTRAPQWRVIRSLLAQESNRKNPNVWSLDYEDIYWHEGARRAYQGYVDVWDTALVALINRGSYFALLPGNNLISNVGNDIVATHTGSDKLWTHAVLGNYGWNNFEMISINPQADSWLKENFYQIKFRHLITTRITRLLDFFRTRKFDYLVDRWQNLSTK